MNILVVDDETDVKFLFKQRFRKEIKSGSVNLEFAFSGEEALSYLSENHQDSHLILSDINMPGMSGLDLLAKVKEIYDQSPKVMMITAYGDDENHKKAIALGADDFFTKPVDFKILKEKLLN